MNFLIPTIDNVEQVIDPHDETLLGQSCAGAEHRLPVAVPVATVATRTGARTLVCRFCLVDTAAHVAAITGPARLHVPVWRSLDAVRAAGITYRQLDYWSHQLPSLSPEDKQTGTGYQKHWLADSVVLMRSLGQLTACGVPVHRAAHIASRGADEVTRAVEHLNPSI